MVLLTILRVRIVLVHPFYQQQTNWRKIQVFRRLTLPGAKGLRPENIVRDSYYLAIVYFE